MIDLEPIIPGYDPPPKRRYTVTDRVLAACRANLDHANAIPRDFRFRSTDKRRHASRHNLTLALAAKKRDRSPRYATCFRNGWYVADPERALPLVGATPEEYRRHLEAWRREINPQDLTEEKLAHAIGMLSWRWIAGVRLECDLETLKIFRLLQALAAERRPGAAMGAAGAILDAQAGPLPVTAEQLTYLGYEIDQALLGGLKLEAPLARISARMLRLWQELLQRRDQPLLDLKMAGCRSHLQQVVIAHSTHSPYELAAPFASCCRTTDAVRPNAREVPPVEQWVKDSQELKVESRESKVESQESKVESQESQVESQESVDSQESKVESQESKDSGDDGAFRGEAHRSDLAMLLEARRLGWELPGSFEGLLRLVEAAIGSPGSDGVPRGRWERRVRLFARAVWKSLAGLRRHAGDLAAHLNRHLGDYASSLWPESWRRSFYQMARSAQRLAGSLFGGAPEGQTEDRRDDLTDYYYELRLGLGRQMFARWQRCRAAMAVVCRE